MPSTTVGPQTDEDTTITEAVWRRLQTIFRRHQGTDVDAGPPETPPDLRAAESLEPGSDQAPISVPSTDHEASEEPLTEAGHRRDPITELPSTSRPEADREVDEDAVRLRVVPAQLGEPPSSPPDQMVAPQSPVSPGLQVAGTDLAEVASEGWNPAQGPPTASPGIAGSVEDALRIQAPPADPRQESPAHPGTTRALTNEQLWRVERLPESAPTSATGEGPSSMPPSPSGSAARRSDEPAAKEPSLPPGAAPDGASDEHPRRESKTPSTPHGQADTAEEAPDGTRIVAHVAAGRPTGSTIEMLAPRRPRPALSERATRSTVAQRLTRPPGPSIDEPAAQPPPTSIPTPIGPLPADLWTLIGEPVPSPSAEAPATPTTLPDPSPDHRSRDGGSGPGTTAPRTVATHTHAPAREAVQTSPPVRRPSTGTAPAAAPAHIQRMDFGGVISALERSAPSSGRAEPSGPTPGGPGSTAGAALEAMQSPAGGADDEATPDEAPSVDMTELARRVYDEVKRRLTLEGERFRGR